MRGFFASFKTDLPTDQICSFFIAYLQAYRGQSPLSAREVEHALALYFWVTVCDQAAYFPQDKEEKTYAQRGISAPAGSGCIGRNYKS